MITKGDKALIVSVIIIAFLVLMGFKAFGFTDDKRYVLIEVDGSLHQKISIGANGPNSKITVPVANGKNTVEIDKNRVRMLYADCPDKDCVNQSWISRPGQMIVCLPNRVIIKIENKPRDKADIDAVSY